MNRLKRSQCVTYGNYKLHFPKGFYGWATINFTSTLNSQGTSTTRLIIKL